MKCPVCKTEIKTNITECSVCGFNKLQTEFINQDDLMRWMEETVIPCQNVYKTMKRQCDAINNRLSEYEVIYAKYNLLQKDYADLRDRFALLERSNPSYPNALTTSSKDGIVVPNGVVISKLNSTTCEVSNFMSVRKQAGTDITFIVKMVEGSPNSYFGFRWKLKNNQGIIISNGTWSKSGISPGDVLSGNIWLFNIFEPGYLEVEESKK